MACSGHHLQLLANSIICRVTKFHSLGQMVEENRGADNACIGKLSSNRLENRVVGAACARIVPSLVQTPLRGLQRFFGFLNAHDGTIAGDTGLGNTQENCGLVAKPGEKSCRKNFPSAHDTLVPRSEENVQKATLYPFPGQVLSLTPLLYHRLCIIGPHDAPRCVCL